MLNLYTPHPSVIMTYKEFYAPQKENNLRIEAVQLLNEQETNAPMAVLLLFLEGNRTGRSQLIEMPLQTWASKIRQTEKHMSKQGAFHTGHLQLIHVADPSLMHTLPVSNQIASLYKCFLAGFTRVRPLAIVDSLVR